MIRIIFFIIFITATSTSFSCASEPIKIAAIFGYSGKAAASNQASYLGVKYGVEEINRRGGILGRPIELVELDNKSTPIGSKVAADKAVKMGVTAIIGASWSSHSLAVAKVAEKNGTPMISTDSTHEDVTRIGDYIFRTCFIDPFQGRVMAHFAVTELGAKTASIVVNSASDYSTGLADVFTTFFTKYGGTVEKVVYYKHRQDHFRAEMRALKKVDSDVLFVPGHDESAAIVLEAAETGIKSIPLGCDGWSTTHFFELAGSKVNLGYYSSHWAEGVKTTLSKKFVATYKQKGTMLSSEPLGYDAVLLLADAIERARSVDPEPLKQALQETSNFMGVTGVISFNRYGDPIKPAVVLRIQKGDISYLKSISPEMLERTHSPPSTEEN